MTKHFRILASVLILAVSLVILAGCIFTECKHEGGAATCTSKAVCTRCGEEYGEVLGHDLVTDAAKAPTCTESGLTEGKHCSRCDYKVAQENVAALGHKEVVDAAVDATCYSKGLTEGKHCSECKAVLVAQAETDMIPHTYDTEGFDKTCNAEGCTYTRTCAHDGEKTTVKGYAATCTETGLTDGEKCAICGDVTKAQETIKALDHDMAEATCTAPAHCKRGGCAYTEGEKLEHSYNEGVVTTAPDCETKGVKTFTCTADGCGHSYEVDVDATGHNYGEADCDSPATCELCGSTSGSAIGHADDDKDHKCDRCETEQGTHEDKDKNHACDYGCSVAIGTCEDVNPKDHKCDYGCDADFGKHEDVNPKDHKCDYGCSVAIGDHADGDDNDHLCDYCNEVMGDHSYTSSVTAPTCLAAGYTTYTCNCGHSYTDNETTKLDHVDENGDEKCDYGCGTDMPKPRYTVTLNYGSKTKTVDVKEGDALTAENLALDSKYPFAVVKWQKDGVDYDTTTPVTEAITLTAVLESYKVFEKQESWKNSGSTTNTEIEDTANPDNTILQFTTVGNFSGIYSQNLHVYEDFADVRYIYLKVRANVNTKINLRFFNANNAFGSNYMQSGQEITADGKWQIVCIDLDSLTITGTAFSKEEIKLMFVMSSVAATVEIDDIYFAREEIEIELPEEEPEEKPEGVVESYDFESNNAGWIATGTSTTVELVQTGALSGTQSINVSITSGYNGIMNNGLADVDMGSVNYIYFKIKSNTAIANLQLRIYADAGITNNRTGGLSATTIVEGTDYKIIRFDISNWDALTFNSTKFTKDDIKSVALLGVYGGTNLTIDDITFATTELTFE